MTVFVKNIKGPVHDISNLETVGSYSIDGNKRYRNDLSQLKYYKKPRNCNRVYFDLNEGTVYESAEDPKIDFLLKWILENLDRLKVEDLENPTRWLKPEFICSRGLLKKLLSITFRIKRHIFTFMVHQWSGRIFC
ncbi:hypothetical protein WH47_03284 [Habropoda laboriosa]|uniref:Decapping nuclease n=1 Tax=Habropoda laboriosa TaxID=597456 RepID=A0A0L7RBK4_9HYME|nr:hypothetical protein WH47_03284 [Habropoda laboriosa]